MSAKSAPRLLWVSGIGAIALVCLTAIFWQNILFGVAAVIQERRPQLLADAQWRKAGTARMFKQRFASGTSEAELISWLQANRFKIDKRDGEATKRVAGMPCGERLEVRWTRTEGGTLGDADASVFEAGCL